jgi:hypothetical protein
MSKFNGGKFNMFINLWKDYRFNGIGAKISLFGLRDVGYFYIIQSRAFVSIHNHNKKIFNNLMMLKGKAGRI